MKGYAILFAVMAAIGMACGDFGGPVHEETPVVPPVGANRASFYLNGSKHIISVFAERNGYNLNELVIRGSGVGLENTLMMTFKPIQGGASEINVEMTGYWDLGLCIPFNKYLLSNSPSNVIRVTSYDRGSGFLKGEFDLTFSYEKDMTKVVSFTNGTFEAVVDTVAFKYCVEG